MSLNTDYPDKFILSCSYKIQMVGNFCTLAREKKKLRKHYKVKIQTRVFVQAGKTICSPRPFSGKVEGQKLFFRGNTRQIT